MKQILRISKGKFLQLDSYIVSHETRRQFLVVTGISLMIASLTAGALLGTDITQPNLQINHERTK